MLLAVIDWIALMLHIMGEFVPDAVMHSAVRSKRHIRTYNQIFEIFFTADLVMDKITFGNDVGPSTGESETGGAEGSKVHRVVVEFSPWKSSEVLAQ